MARRRLYGTSRRGIYPAQCNSKTISWPISGVSYNGRVSGDQTGIVVETDGRRSTLRLRPIMGTMDRPASPTVCSMEIPLEHADQVAHAIWTALLEAGLGGDHA